MAKVQSFLTPEELVPLRQKTIQARDRFTLGAVQSQRRPLSRAKRRLLTRPAITNSPMKGRGSLFKKFSPMWRDLPQYKKDNYKAGGVPSFLTNWQLYISDNAARLRHSLPLEQPVSEIWQVRTGRIFLTNHTPAFVIKQEHPHKYTVTRKVRKMPWKEEMVNITEYFALPIKLEIRYKSNLLAVGSTQQARYFARIWSSYQGVDIFTDLEINFDAVTDWVHKTVQLPSIRGIVIGYTLYIEILGYTGEILFDNLRCIHSGQNWVRDPRCDNVGRVFKGGFSEVKPFWEIEKQPSETFFGTVYPPAL